MLSTDASFPSSGACDRSGALGDYAFDELPADERREFEQHLTTCADCALELDQLRFTTAALRTLPDREIPQRIAFVSDRVFEPSWFRRFWNSGARLGFASACVVAVAIVISAWHFSAIYRPAEVRTVVQTASVPTDQIDAAVAKAVAQIKSEQAQLIQAAVESSERKQEAEYRNQVIGMQESFDRLRRKLNVNYASLASNDLTGSGAGQ
jgi:anti-sigma-K factor RskA